MQYTKNLAKKKGKQKANLEQQLNNLEKSLDEDHYLSKYNSIKNKLNVL